MAAWGYCATKQEYFYGLRGHLVITLAGTAVAFTVTAANIDERDVVPNLYGTIQGLLIGDKGFISGDLKLEAAAHEIDLQTPLRKNMPEDRDPGAVARLMRIRRAVETAIGKLSESVRRPDNQGAGPSKLREPNGQKDPRLQLLSCLLNHEGAENPRIGYTSHNKSKYRSRNFSTYPQY